MKWFRGGLVFKAHRLVYHSALGWGVIKKRSLAAHVHLSLVENVGALLHVVLLLVEFLDKAAFRVQSLGSGMGFKASGQGCGVLVGVFQRR